jgi:hypothetical protein
MIDSIIFLFLIYSLISESNSVNYYYLFQNNLFLTHNFPQKVKLKNFFF